VNKSALDSTRHFTISMLSCRAAQCSGLLPVSSSWQLALAPDFNRYLTSLKRDEDDAYKSKDLPENTKSIVIRGHLYLGMTNKFLYRCGLSGTIARVLW